MVLGTLRLYYFLQHVRFAAKARGRSRGPLDLPPAQAQSLRPDPHPPPARVPVRDPCYHVATPRDRRSHARVRCRCCALRGCGPPPGDAGPPLRCPTDSAAAASPLCAARSSSPQPRGPLVFHRPPRCAFSQNVLRGSHAVCSLSGLASPTGQCTFQVPPGLLAASGLMPFSVE